MEESGLLSDDGGGVVKTTFIFLYARICIAKTAVTAIYSIPTYNHPTVVVAYYEVLLLKRRSRYNTSGGTNTSSKKKGGLRVGTSASQWRGIGETEAPYGGGGSPE